MRVATWNVNGLRARFELVRKWLKERDPDVVAMQEIKMSDLKDPRTADDPLGFKNLGYNIYAFGDSVQRSRNGVALLAKKKMKVTQVGLPGQEHNGSRLLTAVIDGVSITNVYCPNGKDLDHKDFDMKIQWYRSLCEYWETVTKEYKQAIITGDFNIVPASRDSWKGKEGDDAMFHTAQERDALQKLVKLSLHDLFRELNPGIKEFTWWDYRGGSWERGQGLRIDMIYGTSAIRARTEEVKVDRGFRQKTEKIMPSDHVPVVAELSD